MFDTHCHLNFKRFKDTYSEVIRDAKSKGVIGFIIPGTDLETSKKAVDIARENENVYAALGIHPHHAKSHTGDLKKIEDLLKHEKVVAIGEVGMDRHIYQNTKYKDYKVDKEFINLQKDLLIKQINLAVKHNKSLILHNREAVQEILEVLRKKWNRKFEGKVVFHCCEPNRSLLEFAKENEIYLGIDGDITYSEEKQEFIKSIPLDLLVLETDSPFLLPEPLRAKKLYPNTPSSLPIIGKFIANLLGIEYNLLVSKTTQNARNLFLDPKGN